MSLVAYAASSDEEEEDEIINSRNINPETEQTKITEKLVQNEYISDDDDFFPTVPPEEISLGSSTSKNHLSLPAPRKQDLARDPDNEISIFTLSLHNKLPLPKTSIPEVLLSSKKLSFEEEDDEFLRKKAIAKEKPPLRNPVRITIPSLAQFKDLDDEKSKKSKASSSSSSKSCNLLNLLPKPKSEEFMKKSALSINEPTKSNTSFVPDSVKNRQQKQALVKTSVKVAKPKIGLVDVSDDDSSGDDASDFFSLNAKEKLPEVSQIEIDTMVAKRVAKMATTTNKMEFMNYKQQQQEVSLGTHQEHRENIIGPQSENRQIEFDQKAIQALVGSQAKKRKHIVEDVQVVDLSSSQVLPDRDEWLRSTLTSETSYQAKGVLVDEEPAPGTRRKHQITYLAHQAKANEAELQAMWATNRQNRRATASKYGF